MGPWDTKKWLGKLWLDMSSPEIHYTRRGRLWEHLTRLAGNQQEAFQGSKHSSNMIVITIIIILCDTRLAGPAQAPGTQRINHDKLNYFAVVQRLNYVFRCWEKGRRKRSCRRSIRLSKNEDINIKTSQSIASIHKRAIRRAPLSDCRGKALTFQLYGLTLISFLLASQSF